MRPFRRRAPTGRLRSFLLAGLLLLGASTPGPGPEASAARAGGGPSAEGAAAIAWTVAGLRAQEPGADPGAVRTGLLLRELRGTKRVLVVGAHPDDEDTALLTTLARGLGADAAYLSLTRGEGGQNLIGPELDEGLGLVRTGELLAARDLDGARQYFTRAYDFGYSKTAEETFRHWPRDSLLADVVRVVRTFRPQVMVSIFSGTPADGHGQHEVAGLLAREAFDAAGDPSRFPEQVAAGLEPWTPLKLYRRTWRDPGESTLGVPTGRLDPLLGRSHHQLAMASRSQHRSQDFGTAQPPGPHTTRLRLLDSRVAGSDTALFAGVDTTLTGLADSLPAAGREAVRRELEAYLASVDRAFAALSAVRPAGAAPALAEALERLRAAEEALPSEGPGADGLAWVLDRKRAAAREALLSAAGVSLQLRADDDAVVPGQEVGVTVDLWNGGPFSLRPGTPALAAPEGWDVSAIRPLAAPEEEFFGPSRPAAEGGEPPAPDEPLAPGALRRWRATVRVPDDAAPSTPYFLREDRAGGLYRWPEGDSLRGAARNPPLVTGAVPVALTPAAGGGEVRAEARGAVRYRGVDKARGEFWRPLQVVPAVSVAPDPRVMVWPEGDPDPRRLTVTLRGAAPGPVTGTLALEVPPGWDADPAEASFRLEGPGAVSAHAFRLRPAGAAAAGASEGGSDTGVRDGAGARGAASDADEVRIRAVARGADGRRWTREAVVVDYPHIEPALLLVPAETGVRRFPVRVDERRVAYVPGSGDDIPEAMSELGIAAEVLPPDGLQDAALDRFDLIVLGVRAYEVSPALAVANGRLLDWVRGGGTLLVQYNKYEFDEGGFAPYPLCMDRPHDRVTDETAEVRLLAPDAPVFTGPNRIGPEDFRGWEQELGLYFLGDWDPRYTPLLSMSDPGEEPTRGSLLVTTVGEGLWIYTGLALFRQLPEGVPGAYRVLANLISLEPEEWRAFAGAGGGPGPAGAGRGDGASPRGGPPGADDEVSCRDRWDE